MGGLLPSKTSGSPFLEMSTGVASSKSLLKKVLAKRRMLASTTSGTNITSTMEKAKGKKLPDTATITFKWDAFETETDTRDNLNKPRGGFWVGLSPEGLIALGMTCFKDAIEGETK
eukprot:5718453-Ditylum_brightwellii.AAC.1